MADEIDAFIESLDNASKYSEPIAYDAADEAHGIAPADAAWVLIVVGISRLRASLPPDELKAELHELSWQIALQAENRVDQGHNEGTA
jgi:hypothetical protein